MRQPNGFYPRVQVDTSGSTAVGQAGGVLLTETVRAAGLDRGLSAALARWCKPTAVHDPAKVITDLAVTLAVGGDCLADVALLRAEPGVYGPVASDPTVSRTIDALAADAPAALKAIDAARAAARARVWALAGEHAPDHGVHAADPLVIDVDATLVTAHSEKEHAAPTFKRGFGFHPVVRVHRPRHRRSRRGRHRGTVGGDAAAGVAGSNIAADHIAILRQALAQLPFHRPGTRAGSRVLVRTDAAGCTHAVLDWIARQRMAYSVGFTLPEHTDQLLRSIPAHVWVPAYDAHDEVRDGAWVAEITDLLDLTGWPPGMRVIVRKERPHPGAQLRITDPDGLRVTAFATNTRPGGPGAQLADLELRHRRRARAEDRIRVSKDTGLSNLPLHDYGQNQIWVAIVALAVEITAWMQMLALTGHHARRWEPKRLRLRLFTIPATLARTGRRILLHLAEKSPWATLATAAFHRLRALAAPG